MAFRVGQKVVCVDDSPPAHPSSLRVQLHAVYTIRGFDDEDRDQFAFYLEEIPDDPTPPEWTTPRGWRATRFRPIVERKTDISIFERMLRERVVENV